MDNGNDVSLELGLKSLEVFGMA